MFEQARRMFEPALEANPPAREKCNPLPSSFKDLKHSLSISSSQPSRRVQEQNWVLKESGWGQVYRACEFQDERRAEIEELKATRHNNPALSLSWIVSSTIPAFSYAKLAKGKPWKRRTTFPTVAGAVFALSGPRVESS